MGLASYLTALLRLRIGNLDKNGCVDRANPRKSDDLIQYNDGLAIP